MEDTTALGDSQPAISEPNQHYSPGSKVERPSDPTRSKQSSLCNICAHGLSLDDSRARGALGELRNDVTPNLCFPCIGERVQTGCSYFTRDIFTWKGGAKYEQRDFTPPHLPELSDECKFCHTVKNALLNGLGQYEWWHTTTEKLRSQVQYEWLGEKMEGCQLHFELSSLRVEATHPELDRENKGWLLEFPIATSSSLCQEWLHISGRPVDVESPFSKRNVNLIRSWLEECSTDPRCCRSAKTEKFLPTRLLDVGSKASKTPFITLVETQYMAQLEESDGSLEYICLSYTWGAADPPLKTTKDTIEGYKEGIRIDSMPQVFRDAVLVARTFGIRYLWIDSLCIIQGCHEDWHNESAAMADVFSHSWMTVGAVTASSCHESLFYPRKDFSIDIDFQSSIKQNITGTISILLLSQYYRDPLHECIRSSIWNTRGWVWQEQMLPQRLLLFGEKMLHFKCHQRMLHEYGTRRSSLYGTEPLSLKGPNQWSLLMHQYSRRELSRGSDRLAAISGCVKALAQQLEDAGKSATYIAGIWIAKDAVMDSQLCWYVQNPTISFRQLLRYHKDPQKYIAPSWSWTTLNRPVNTMSGGHLHKSLFQVITHTIKPARSDPTVAVAPGSSITLLGKLRKIPGTLSMRTKPSKYWDIGRKTYWKAPYSGVEKVWQGIEQRERDVAGNVKCLLDWNPSIQDFAEGYSEDLLNLFLLTECTIRGGEGGIGLVLYPDVVDSSLFLRVGSFVIKGPWRSLDWKETKVVII